MTNVNRSTSGLSIPQVISEKMDILTVADQIVHNSASLHFKLQMESECENYASGATLYKKGMTIMSSNHQRSEKLLKPELKETSRRIQSSGSFAHIAAVAPVEILHDSNKVQKHMPKSDNKSPENRASAFKAVAEID